MDDAGAGARRRLRGAADPPAAARRQALTRADAAAGIAASAPAMQRVTSRHNPRLREAARAHRVVARPAQGRQLRARRRAPDRRLSATAYGAPETLIVTEEALARPARARAGRARMPARTLVVPAALFAELATLPAGVGVLAVVATPRAGAAGAGRFLPAARRRAGSGQRRLDAALRGCGRRRAGAAVEALRVRVVAEGAARGAGRAFPADIHEDVDLPPGRAPIARRGSVVAAVAAGGDDPLRDARCRARRDRDRQRRRGTLGGAAGRRRRAG